MQVLSILQSPIKPLNNQGLSDSGEIIRVRVMQNLKAIKTVGASNITWMPSVVLL